ncbi:hypothetical protein LTR37_007520 [Vermiconidia calcicola]|uniref:Uncharacterized protein n=1 Tax=Vermiconidia calcicola TaxID=1690605 RepID=A0ACC3NDB1_9PEZI|nr:hypothetical protein LTR37_007520 [Vermiconidia calcicola]
MEPAFQFRVLDDILSHATTKERSRISQQLLRQVSEIATVDEIRTAIECDRGWNREWKTEGFETPKFLIDNYQKKLSPSASRKHLKHIWIAFRSALKSHQQKQRFPQYIIDEDWAALSAADRAEHVEAVEEEKRAVHEKISQQTLAASKKETTTSFVPLPTSTGGKAEKQTDSEEASTSLHTTSEDAGASAAIEKPPSTSTVLVKPENLKLFNAMFPTDKGQSRSFSWKHFLQAMVDAGFSVLQGSGSAVSFRNDRGVIVFHQPHPEPSIDPIMLQLMGKRLHKWFGWDSDVFVTREEGAPA